MQNLSFIKQKLSKAHPSLIDACFGYVLSRFATSEQADEVVAFFEKNPLPSSSRRISQLVEGIRSNAALLSILTHSKLAEAEYWN
jgi:hypothetical protein